MRVTHVRTGGVSTEYDATFIKIAVGMVDGVRDVAAVPSIGLISVLYDDERSDPTDIIEAVCSAGFEACQCHPRDVLVATHAAA